MDELRWHNFLYDLLWLVPLAASIASVGFALVWQRRSAALSTVYLCFALAVLVFTLGALGSWRGGLELFVILGVAGDISAELLYEGWKRSWHPLYYSVTAVGALLLIATIAKRKGDRLRATASTG